MTEQERFCQDCSECPLTCDEDVEDYIKEGDLYFKLGSKSLGKIRRGKWWKMKDKIIKLLEEVDRPGIPDLINYLCKSDFFTAPASVKHHLNWEGGLALYSYLVYTKYAGLHERYGSLMERDFKFEHVIVESLLHDLCKIDKYKIDDEPASIKQIDYLMSLAEKNNVDFAKLFSDDIFDIITKSFSSELIDWLKNRPDEEPPKYKTNYTYADDNFPFGHGEKSVSILQDFIKLEDREKLAIRYHMGSWEKGLMDSVWDGGKKEDYNRARELYPDVQLLQMADYEATFAEQFMKVGDWLKIYGLYQEYAHDKPFLRDLYKTKELAEKEKNKLSKEFFQMYVGPYFKIKEIEVIEEGDEK